MLNNLIEELKVLAENILKEDQANDLASRLSQSRELYEKLLVLRHELAQEEQKKSFAQEELPASELQQEVPEMLESVRDDSSEPEIVTTTEVIEEEPPLSLNDLFVPTFDGIKEDMSQKAEFKDTISLDETENLFQIKKEEPRQLSLNDKLVGSSITSRT